MKNGMKIFLAVVFTIIPLCESNAASVDDFLGRTYVEIAPAFRYSLAYEDNIDGDRSGKDRESDWSNRYEPEILLTAFSPKASISSSAKLKIVEYINERDYNYVDQNYTFGLGLLPSERTEISLAAGYTVDSDAYRIDEGEGVGLGEKTNRYKDKTWDFNAGLSYEIGPRSMIGLSGFVSDYETYTSNDVQLWGVIASYTNSLSPRTNALLTASYFYYDFEGNKREEDEDDPVSVYSYVDQEMKNYSLTVGLEHNFANESYLSVSGGTRYTDLDSTNYNDGFATKSSGNGQGWLLDIQWKRTWTEWAQTFELNHDINVNPTGTTYESTSALSRTTYIINQRLSATLYLQIKNAEGDGDEFLYDRDTVYYTVQPSVDYKLYRWLTANVGYQYRYYDYKEERHSTHFNMFYVRLKFSPLRNLVVR